MDLANAVLNTLDKTVPNVQMVIFHYFLYVFLVLFVILMEQLLVNLEQMVRVFVNQDMADLIVLIVKKIIMGQIVLLVLVQVLNFVLILHLEMDLVFVL